MVYFWHAEDMTKNKSTSSNGTGNQHVTQTEFSAAMGAIKQDFDAVHERLDQTATKADIEQLRDEMTTMQETLRDEMAEMQETILRRFEAVAEAIHLDVAGAKADQISLIADKQEQHEGRITTLEQRFGLRP